MKISSQKWVLSLIDYELPQVAKLINTSLLYLQRLLIAREHVVALIIVALWYNDSDVTQINQTLQMCYWEHWHKLIHGIYVILKAVAQTLCLVATHIFLVFFFGTLIDIYLVQIV